MADKFSLKAVISATAPIINTLKQVNVATRTTRKHLADVGRSAVDVAGKVGVPVGLIGTALAGLTVAGIQRAVMGFAQLGDEVAKSSQRIGVSIRDYQLLKYVAGQSGVSAEELATSVEKLNRNVALAVAGKNKDIAALFKRAGISMRDANGQLRTGADLLPEVADLFVRNGNAAVQARMGNAIFGRSWMTLAPLLNGGRAGIEALTDRYRMLGLEIDESAIKAGEAFGDQVDDLQQAVRAYGYQIAAKLLPVLSPMIERTIRWAAANRELITTRVSAFVSEFAGYVSRIDWAGVVSGINSVIGGMRSLVEFVGGARNALIALVVFMNANAIAATLGLVASIARLTWGLGAMTVTAIPAAVASLKVLGTSMLTAGTAANGLLGLLGKIGAVAGAGFVGWEIGKRLNDLAINPLARLLTGDREATLGTAIYDLFNKDPLAEPRRSSIVAPASKARVEGEVKVSFANAPPGLRVEQKGGGAFPLNLDVGYSSAAAGRPY